MNKNKSNERAAKLHVATGVVNARDVHASRDSRHFRARLLLCRLRKDQGILVVYNQLTMHHVLTFTPSAFTEVLHDVIIKSGQHLRLRCQLSSLPTHPYTVTWTKNKRCIENDDYITIVSDGCTLALDISSAETVDTANYQCIVTFASRRITSSAYVAVVGKNLFEPV